MSIDDGTITSPIPRINQARLADRVRVRNRVAAVEADTDRVRIAAIRDVRPGDAPDGALHVRTGVRAVSREALHRGTVVGEHYRILERIARGGTAIVYRAQHLTLGRPVALKVLTPPQNPRAGNDFERRFILEARTLASLSHPNIVDVLDFGRIEDGRCYLAMELIEGPRLSDLFEDPGVSASDRLDVLIQVARAIEAAHKRGIIHRDIKLSNVLVVRRGERTVAKVLDFGLAKLVGDEDPELTQHGLTLGSPHFMSPEQARGWALDTRTDIYSLGVLTWCAFTGRFPFQGAGPADTMLQHVMEPVPWLSKVDTLLPVPEGLCATVRRCMAKDPDDRYPEVGEFIDALVEARRRVSQGQLLMDRKGEGRLPLRATRGAPTRLALLGTLLVSVACLWWQERGAVPAPWTLAASEHRSHWQ